MQLVPFSAIQFYDTNINGIGPVGRAAGKNAAWPSQTGRNRLQKGAIRQMRFVENKIISSRLHAEKRVAVLGEDFDD